MGSHAVARDATGGVGRASEGRGEQAMMLIRRVGGPTVTERGEYRVWLTARPSETCRRPFLKLARAKEAKRLRIVLDENAPTLTFVSSGDVKADLQMIDLLLEESSRRARG
jgi:hypothetical protein